MLTMCACQVTEFVRERVLPIEQELRDYYEEEDWTIPAKHQQLQQEAKAAGLWNLFLPLETDPESKYGAGLTNLEYAHLCEVKHTCCCPSCSSKSVSLGPIILAEVVTDSLTNCCFED